MRVVRVTPKKMFDNFMQVRRWWPRLPARSTTRIHCTTSCIDYKIGNILDTNERTGTEPKDAPNFSSAVSVVPATALTLYVVMWPVVNVKVLTAATAFLNATQALLQRDSFCSLPTNKPITQLSFHCLSAPNMRFESAGCRIAGTQHSGHILAL